MACGIHEIVCVVNNKRYIGQSVDTDIRYKKHIKDLIDNKHHSIKLQRAFNKYGKDSFNFNVIKECEMKFLNLFEAYYIELYDSVENGYNMEYIDSLVYGGKSLCSRTTGKCRKHTDYKVDIKSLTRLLNKFIKIRPILINNTIHEFLECLGELNKLNKELKRYKLQVSSDGKIYKISNTPKSVIEFTEEFLRDKI